LKILGCAILQFNIAFLWVVLRSDFENPIHKYFYAIYTAKAMKSYLIMLKIK